MRAERAAGAPLGPLRAVGFRGQLRVFWWAADARGRRARATHAPVEVAFADAAGLRAALEGFARAAAWERVLARRADAGLAAVLFERGAARDFEAEAGRFLARLRERGRSRCELEVHECGAGGWGPSGAPAGGAGGGPAGAPWGPAGDPAWEADAGGTLPRGRHVRFNQRRLVIG